MSILKMKNEKKIHLVNLFKWHSVTALCASALTLVLSLGSIAFSITTNKPEYVHEQFEWFTIDASVFTALAAMMIIPFAIEGIRKKRLTYPKWVLLFHYSATINVMVIKFFTVAFISWFDPELAFGEENFFLHVICPSLVLVSFLAVEAIYPLTRKDSLIAMIPFMIYALFYTYNVIITHNWEDHYKLNEMIPFYISAFLMLMIAYLIAFLIRKAHNALLGLTQERIKKIWDKDLDEETVKEEIYSLGVHAGMHEHKENISEPYDIFEQVNKKFNIELEDLVSSYNQGVIEGLKKKHE